MKNLERLSPESEDIDLDGFAETRNIVDPVTRRREQRLDLNKDGRADVFKFFDRDSRLERTLSDRNFDGVIDQWDFSYASRPHVHTFKADLNFDKKVDRIVFVHLVDEKVEYKKFWDKKGDGIFDAHEVSPDPEFKP